MPCLIPLCTPQAYKDSNLISYPDPVYQPPANPVKIPIPEFPGKMNINPEFNANFHENSPFQGGVISETYQRPDKSSFKSLKSWKILLYRQASTEILT